MRVDETTLPGVLRIETRIFADERGRFLENWSAQRYADLGIAEQFVQDNVSWSRSGVLRGLHFQETPYAQGKLVSVLRGEIWDVAVDVRPESENFGRWVGVTLSAEAGVQVYIPPGFAHGFLVTGEEAMVAYKCTDYYHSPSERTVIWNDPAVGIDWPVNDPVLSEKDRKGSLLRELRPGNRVAAR